MIEMIEGLYEKLFRFCRESSGGVMIYFGIMLPVLLEVASLSVDVGLYQLAS